jgi:hypothetical protein
MRVISFPDFSIIDLDVYKTSLIEFLRKVKSERGFLDLASRREQGLSIERCSSALIGSVRPNGQTQARKQFDLVVQLIVSELLKNRLNESAIGRLATESQQWLKDGLKIVSYAEALRDFGLQIDRGNNPLGIQEKNVIVFKDGSYCNIYFYRAAVAFIMEEKAFAPGGLGTHFVNHETGFGERLYYDGHVRRRLEQMLAGVASGLALERFERVFFEARKELIARDWKVSVEQTDSISNLVLSKLTPRSTIGTAKLASSRIKSRLRLEEAKADEAARIAELNGKKKLKDFVGGGWQPEISVPQENPDELSFEEAEHLCAEWMKFLGISDARVTQLSSDAGIDVDSRDFAAQVKHQFKPVGREPLQRLRGAMHDHQIGVFFSYNGYSRQAIDWGNERGLALFTYKHQKLVCESRLARQIWKHGISSVLD